MQLSFVNSDNMKVIDTIKSGGCSARAAAAVFDDCYHLACDFTISRFERWSREANRVAHELTRLARISSNFDWFEEPLNEIVTLLIDDVSIISIE
ncbi:hypothetical protein CFC21_044274 [Triticum aestivum]|uniref:RNase H type-1 domain-containing protein n=2 Tax=Triticum aestivum TaxID=4565 RepID=A0A3B6G0G2_WHEAT|nr:hypothetical protein CFC21_044274 [Triticum aestivum]